MCLKACCFFLFSRQWVTETVLQFTTQRRKLQPLCQTLNIYSMTILHLNLRLITITIGYMYDSSEEHISMLNIHFASHVFLLLSCFFQNDLLDEICSDIGIKDTMELDFVDFEPGFNNIKSWDTNNMKKPGFEDDILDQIIPFGDEERRTSGETEPVLGFTKLSEEPIGKLNNKVKIETNSPVCSPVVHSTSGNAQGMKQRAIQ